MIKNSNDLVVRYKDIMEKFLTNMLTAKEFEQQYIQMWRKDRDTGAFNNTSSNIQEYIDKTFTALDVYDPDAIGRDPFAIDETTLRKEVQENLRKLLMLAL